MIRTIPKILVITFLVTACGTKGKTEEKPDIPGKIAFTAKDESSTFQIFTMNADGSEIRQLTEGEFSSSDPDWSPNGQRIAFTTARDAPVGSDALWGMKSDGSNQRPLVFSPLTGKPQFGNQPDWSPNGTKLAFDRCIDCEAFGRNVEVFVADLQTGTLDTLVQHQGADGGSEWSPNGRRLLFGSDRACDRLPLCVDIYCISVDGKESKRITFFSGDIGSFNWLSSDSFFYAPLNKNTQHRDLIIYNLESGEQRPVLTNLNVNQFWVLWDPISQRFLSFEKKHNKVPVTVTLFDMNGNTMEEIVLTDPVLKSAIGFTWKNFQ